MIRKSMLRAKVFALLLFGGLMVVWPARTRAQAPPGPQSATPPPGVQPPAAKPQPPPRPLPPPRQVILGDWKLNRDQSDDTRNRSDDDQGSNNGGSGRRSGGGYPGGGYPGGGYPGGNRGGMPRGDSEAVQEKLHELLTPPARITFSATGAEVDLMDDQDRKRAFMTDGRKLQKPKDNGYVEIAAHWDGKALVSDEKGPRGGKMSRTFELSEDGRQLYETIRMDGGKSGRSMNVRFVYDIPVAATSR